MKNLIARMMKKSKIANQSEKVTNKKPNPISQLLHPFVHAKKVNYSYMITGKWGSGKTHYLRKEFLEDFPHLEKKVIYVSSNGVSSIDQILEQIIAEKFFTGHGNKSSDINRFFKNVEEVHPVLKSGMSLIGLGLKRLVSRSIENDELVIIDDLERISDDYAIVDFFGDINTRLIEHRGIKVLFVCNEQEIKSVGYLDSKEKYIRRTISFQQDILLLLPNLISEINISDKTKNIILNSDLRRFISSACHFHQMENLRNLSFILECYGEILERIGSLDVKLSTQETLFLSTFILGLEYRKGMYTCKSSENSMEYLRHDRMTISFSAVLGEDQSDNESQKTKQEDKFLQDYFLLKEKIGVKYIYFNSIRELIRMGISEELEHEIDQYMKANQPASPESLLIDSLRPQTDLEDNEFSKNLRKVLQITKEGKYGFYQLMTLHTNVNHHIKYGAITTISEAQLDDLLTNALPSTLDKTTFDPNYSLSIESLRKKGHYGSSLLSIEIDKINTELNDSAQYASSFESLGRFLLCEEVEHNALINYCRFLRGEAVDPIINHYKAAPAFQFQLLYALEGARIPKYPLRYLRQIKQVLGSIYDGISEYSKALVEGPSLPRSKKVLKAFDDVFRELEDKILVQQNKSTA